MNANNLQPRVTLPKPQRAQHAARKAFPPANRPRSISHHPIRAKAQHTLPRPAFARSGESRAVVNNTSAPTRNTRCAFQRNVYTVPVVLGAPTAFVAHRF
jgi:hypothetical protein